MTINVGRTIAWSVVSAGIVGGDALAMAEWQTLLPRNRAVRGTRTRRRSKRNRHRKRCRVGTVITVCGTSRTCSRPTTADQTTTTKRPSPSGEGLDDCAYIGQLGEIS